MKATTGRIWEATSSEKNRPVLTHVSFDVKNATLTATNAYIAVRVPCEVEDGDESGLIPAAALKEAAGRSLRVGGGVAILALPDGERSWNLLAAGTFPDVDKILADTAEAPLRFGLNPRLLSELGVAMWGAKKDMPLARHPVHPLKGIRVTGLRDTVGVVMPVRLPDSNGHEITVAPDLSDDGAVVAAVRAAVAALNGRRGKKKAAQAFRDALRQEATV